MVRLFQSFEYYEFLKKTGILSPFRYTIARDDHDVGILEGYIQKDGGLFKRFLSRRAIVNGGPYWASDASFREKEELIRKAIIGLKRRVIYLETRNFNDYSAERP